MKTSNQQTFNISKDQLLQLKLDVIKKDRYLFELSDISDDKTFWFTVNRKKLEEMLRFIDEYVQDN
jgi:hypothetical protein